MRDLLDVESFGAVAAENDKRLYQYFLSTPAFERLGAMRSFLAIGRKGTGKTALYQGLEAQASATRFVSGLKFSDYPWRLHHDALNANAADSEKYVNSWHFLMLVELAKLAIRSEAPASADARKALREFIEGIWGNVAFSFRSFYEPTRFQIVKSEIKPQVAGISMAGVSKEWVERTRLGESVGATLNWLEGALVSAVPNDLELFVLFDELDTTFDLADKAYMSQLTGLLLAAKRVATWADAAGKRARALIFLRSDIFDLLQFSDKNKLLADAAVTVLWNDDESGPESLRSLMDQRIRAEFDLKDDEADPWAAVFDGDRMRGNQQQYKYMTARTYLRPRDIIQFANLALREAQARLRRNADGVHRITKDDIYAAREAYSHFLVREFDDELAGSSTGWHDCLEVVRRIHTEVFSPAEFEGEFGKLKGWKQTTSEILEIMYRFGFIGFVQRGGRGGGSDVVFEHRSPMIAFDPEATQFRVHPGLKDYLGVVEER